MAEGCVGGGEGDSDGGGLGGGDGGGMGGGVSTEGSQALGTPSSICMGVASPVSVPPGLVITKELLVPVMVKGPVERSPL